MKSITSGNLVEAKTKQWQKNVLETSPADPFARRPNSSRPKSSQKHPAPQRRVGEVEGTKALSSDQVLDPNIGKTANPIPVFDEQRRDINRIMASVKLLQQDMLSLRESLEHLEDRRDRSSQGLAGNVGILTDNTTKVSSSLRDVDALKLEMKMMRLRVKRMEDSRSTGLRSSTVLDSAQVSRRLSPTTDEQATPRSNAASNGLFFSATQTPVSPCFDGLFAPQKTVSERCDVVDGGESSFQGHSYGSKTEVLPSQKLFTTRPKMPINGTASRASHTAVNMPPPQISRKEPEQNIISRRNSIASSVTTPRRVSTTITGTTKSTILARIISQMQEASTSPHYNHQEDHEYDDELVDDITTQSSIRSSTADSRSPASNTAQSRQTRTIESAQQPPPKTKRRQSVPMPLPTPEFSNKNRPTRGRTAHHDSKRRKTTAFDANTPSISIWAADSRDSRSGSSRRDKQGLMIRNNSELDGRSAKFQNLESQGRKRPGERDEEGYLLRPDGTRDPRSVASMNRWERKKAKAELSC